MSDTAKKTKSFRFSDTTIRRLGELAKSQELSQTTILEQLVKQEAEKVLRKSSR